MTRRQEVQLQATLTAAHESYDKILISYAFFRVHSHAISEDLVQEAFMKTWGYLLKGGEILVMKAFLYRVLKNLIVDEYRKKKTISLDALLEKGFQPSTGDFGRLADILDAKAAVLLIPRLPEPYNKLMHMRYMQDLSPVEISLITGQSRNVISVQIHRGLKKLKCLYNNGPKNDFVYM